MDGKEKVKMQNPLNETSGSKLEMQSCSTPFHISVTALIVTLPYPEAFTLIFKSKTNTFFIAKTSG